MNNWHIPAGFTFTGLHCGIKESGRPDLSLIVSESETAAAGVFTQNRVVAAPVQMCRERLPSASIRAVVINSGNANACTGERGLNDAKRMTELTAQSLGCRPDQVLVCSTGVIGVSLPMDKISGGIATAAGRLGSGQEHLEQAAQGILTTDTRIKVSSRDIQRENESITVTGIAKGAAMIGPNMATMLAFVMTDAAVSPRELAQLAKEAAAKTFNCISVEGHTSTNDTLLLLANGNGKKLAGEHLAGLGKEVISVCADLAREIVADAEGAEHLLKIEVSGLRTDTEAHRVAKTVAESVLVKTAIFGADPNWGRFVSAAGYAGVDFSESDLSLWLGDTLLYDKGSPQMFDDEGASKYIKDNRELALKIRFSLGTGKCTFWTSDLTYEYVRLNAEYTT